MKRKRGGAAAAAPAQHPHVAKALTYAHDVVAGRILACRWVKLACQRHLDDLERSAGSGWPYQFDELAAERVCKFVERFPHVKGKWAIARPGEPESRFIRLEPWQCFIICNLYGWLQKEETPEGRHLRRFQLAYIAVPRKNAKSTTVAPLGLYHVAADDEPGAEVFCGATSKEQALEVFRPARQMAAAASSGGFRRVFGVEVATESLFVPTSQSFFKPLIGNPGDGSSPSAYICDEFHEHRDSSQFDTMRTGMGAREQPISIVITTAGDDVASPCFQLQQDVQKILSGVFQDEETFGIIYTIDEGDDWTTEEALIKANPNYGVSVNPRQLLGLQQEALRSPRKQNVFKTKRLNVWVHARDPWMDLQAWGRAGDPELRPEQFKGQRCWMAMDLSSKLDITAVMRVFMRDEGEDDCRRCDGKGKVELDGATIDCVRCGGGGTLPRRHYTVFGRYYLPEERAQQPEAQHYQGWVHDGYLTTTPGNVIDYEQIKNDILADARGLDLAGLCFDPWNAAATAQELAAEGIPVVEVPQTTKHLSEPMKEIEALVLSDRWHHDGNPVLTWMVSNVTSKEDAKGNLFPRKDAKEAKIDGPAAMITAMSRAMLDNAKPKRSVYETRGVRSYGGPGGS